MTTEIERLLGVTFDREKKIPGTIPSETRKYTYIEDDGKKDFSGLFDRITEKVIPRNATHGGMIEECFRIITPDNQLLHALSYKGDLEGWKKDIELGAKNLNLLTAEIQGDKIVLSDGRSFKLSDCATEDDARKPCQDSTKDKAIMEEKSSG